MRAKKKPPTGRREASMKYYIFLKVREAKEWEENRHSELENCVVWIDIFDTYREALEFSRGYRRAV